MRILVISNFYPPHYLGGYEIGCRDVVEELSRRGHEIAVLTSTYGVGTPRTEGNVHRWLRADRVSYPRRFFTPVTRPFRIFELFRKERTNQRAFRALVRSFGPDLVYIWNPGKISMSLALLAEDIGLPVCYFVSDEWMSRFPQEDLWFRLWGGDFLPDRVRRVSDPVFSSAARALRLRRVSGAAPLRKVQFASRFLLESAVRSGKIIANAEVIHWGIDPQRFRYKPVAEPEARRLLYVGQVVPHKGVHTAVEALRIVRERHEYRSVTLDIFGGSIDPAYVQRLHAYVRESGLEDAVRFRGSVARQQLPSVYQDHDLLIFPSAWNEPFSITLLEGLSSGLPVVGTETGGSREILEHGRNAMVFAAENAHACAAELLKLLDDRELRERIRRNARSTVEERFGFSSMVDRIEESLQEARRAGEVEATSGAGVPRGYSWPD